MRNECVRRGTIYFVQNFHDNVIGELSSSTSSSKSFFSLHCYHVATLNCQLSTLCIVHVMVHPPNHIWRISNLCCALSVSWFTLRAIFGRSVIDSAHCLYYGSPYEAYLVNW